MKTKRMTDAEYKDYIRNHFKYENGIITRNDRKGGMGSFDKDGYLIIKIKGRQFKAHRLAWFLVYGEFPKSELDHINRIRSDNRIENLRESNRQQQNKNKSFPVNPKTGVIGVYVDHTKRLKKKYAFKFGGKTYRFHTLEDAIKEKQNVRQTGSNSIRA